MAQVKATVLQAFTYKGETQKPGTEISMDPVHAAKYERLDFIKLDKESSEKVEKAVEKQEKNKDAGPGKTKN
jgi:hypothetical protein